MRRGYLIDMDGVMYRGKELLPGAGEFVEQMQRQGIPFLFLTNNSAPTAEDLAVKMKHLGLPGISPKQFYTSAMNTADFLAQNHTGCTAYLLGDEGLAAAMNAQGIPNDAIKPDYVVVGEGNPSMERLAKAHQFIENGALLVATNPDNWCPMAGGTSRPGAGSTASFLEASTGRPAYYLGKPNGFMFQCARARLLRQACRNVDQVVMIGDTMETDIRGASESGLMSYLVLTGSTTLEEVSAYVYRPTRILQSVADLAEEIETGKERPLVVIQGGATLRKTAPRLNLPRPMLAS
jgi:NagD protein